MRSARWLIDRRTQTPGKVAGWSLEAGHLLSRLQVWVDWQITARGALSHGPPLHVYHVFNNVQGFYMALILEGPKLFLFSFWRWPERRGLGDRSCRSQITCREANG